MPLQASRLTDRLQAQSLAILGLLARRRPVTFTYGLRRLARARYTWTITSLGNAVNVYGLWVTTSTTPLCSTTNGQPWLSINPASVSGLEASINGGVIAPEGTSLTGIDWNWGDGTTETGCDYFPQSHTYAQSGQYTVVVTTTFTDGTDLQASETVTVTTPAYADILQAIGITQQLETEVASVPLLAAFAHLFQAMQGQLTADLAKVSSLPLRAAPPR